MIKEKIFIYMYLNRAFYDIHCVINKKIMHTHHTKLFIYIYYIFNKIHLNGKEGAIIK